MKKRHMVTIKIGYQELFFDFKDDSETALTFLSTAFESLEPDEDEHIRMGLFLTSEKEEEKNECPDV